MAEGAMDEGDRKQKLAAGERTYELLRFILQEIEDVKRVITAFDDAHGEKGMTIAPKCTAVTACLLSVELFLSRGSLFGLQDRAVHGVSDLCLELLEAVRAMQSSVVEMIKRCGEREFVAHWTDAAVDDEPDEEKAQAEQDFKQTSEDVFGQNVRLEECVYRVHELWMESSKGTSACIPCDCDGRLFWECYIGEKQHCIPLADFLTRLAQYEFERRERCKASSVQHSNPPTKQHHARRVIEDSNVVSFIAHAVCGTVAGDFILEKDTVVSASMFNKFLESFGPLPSLFTTVDSLLRTPGFVLGVSNEILKQMLKNCIPGTYALCYLVPCAVPFKPRPDMARPPPSYSYVRDQGLLLYGVGQDEQIHVVPITRKLNTQARQLTTPLLSRSLASVSQLIPAHQRCVKSEGVARSGGEGAQKPSGACFRFPFKCGSYKWHHSVPRHIAERFLAKHGEGSFLARLSSVGDRLVLSSMIRTEKEGLDYDHHIIEETGVDGEMCALGAGIVGWWSRANPFVRYFSLQFQSDQKHRSLAELISNLVPAKIPIPTVSE